ncbi:centromere/kinetochore protein zw10 homolog [Papilio machaon]|uniref:centromere/kinetochore protein zw10 homolog n=1 Tax=Papilio machaon TaxID=76193 RepID=UPI001E6647EF|nr:centromere/kinetochore protein zw10 homolog [Papilio machaon]
MTDKEDATKQPENQPLDDEALEKLAVEELLREAVQGAARAEIVGPSGWVKSILSAQINTTAHEAVTEVLIDLIVSHQKEITDQIHQLKKINIEKNIKMADYDINSILHTRIIDVDESKWKPSDKIPLINKEIEQVKAEMKTFLQNSDFDVASILREGKELIIESKSLMLEMEGCKNQIEEETLKEIKNSMENHDIIGKELECVNFSLNILNDVLQIGNFVKEFDVGREFQSFVKAVEAVSDLLKYIEEPAEGVQDLLLFESTKNTAHLILDNLIHDMFEEWDRMIVYSSEPGPESTIIKLNLTLDKTLSTLDVLKGLDRCGKLLDKVTQLAQFILSEILIPIIHYDCTVFAEPDQLMTVTITYRDNYKPPYYDVITNLRLLFHYLSNRLNIVINSVGEPIITMVGRLISEEFRDILVKDCLIDTIPNNINDLQIYGKITGEIEDFQRFLYMVKFSHDEDFTILNYINNIDVLFAAKSSQHFLEKARSIMIKDLSASMSIGVENIPVNSKDVENSEDEMIEQGLDVLHQTIPKSLFYFPRCMISKSAQELLDLVYVVMEQAVQCSDVVSKKLYNTARLIFELYDAVVPYHHENFLQNIPQYVALFHNNCMYLAHNLQTFGDKWLTLMEGREVGYAIGFVDLVPKLRELGFRHLAVHMQQQRKQILDNIRTSDLNCIVVKDVLDDNAEAAIRQCLRQLHLLKNVWIGVFPSNVFIRLMATLINMFIDELIHRVCTVEDISMEMAAQLNEMYTLVVQKVPQLFPDGTDVNVYVKSWIKLQELVFVLGGSLRDIDLHWDDGAGPLAKHFTTDELRSLIKALFQNTQFRANLLSKIK